MTHRIVLLTGRQEAAYFEELLLRCNPDLAVTAAHDLTALSDILDRVEGNVRLIAFLTALIVPSELLSKLTITPYNIHPGPPEYPGAHPESFAIWEGASQFGVTAHEMTARVDAGPIIAVDRFPMPDKPERTALSRLAYTRAIELFAVLAIHCAKTQAPMPHIGETWAAHKRTRAQFQALCRAGTRLTRDDMDRLQRSCGDDICETAVAIR